MIGGSEFWCPAGKFVMGSPDCQEGRADDEAERQVDVPRGFWMVKTECTQGQWKVVIGDDPRSIAESDDHPVEHVDWEDAQDFCGKLRAELQSPAGWKVSLPTEAQWERGGMEPGPVCRE